MYVSCTAVEVYNVEQSWHRDCGKEAVGYLGSSSPHIRVLPAVLRLHQNVVGLRAATYAERVLAGAGLG